MRQHRLFLALAFSFATSACGTTIEKAAAGGTSSGSGAGGSTVSGSSSSSSSSASSASSTSSGGDAGVDGGSVTGISGGQLDTLSFAIVGDTRPPTEDDVAGYPTAIITKIWQDVEAASPRPAFAVTTGDYQYSNPTGSMAAPQITAYLTARKAFTNVTFPAMGNHECTGYTDSNCGVGNADGITANYTAYMSAMVTPQLGLNLPYYTANVASTPGATTGSWTAKFVVIAANAWDATQSTWLEGELAKPTTYTFIVRHEEVSANTAPGVTPSEALIAKYPYTLAIVGHSHEYRYESSVREVVVGNGGAPITDGSQYGYVIARQRASDGAIVFTSYAYDTNAVVQTFALTAAGAAAP